MRQWGRTKETNNEKEEEHNQETQQLPEESDKILSLPVSLPPPLSLQRWDHSSYVCLGSCSPSMSSCLRRTSSLRLFVLQGHFCSPVAVSASIITSPSLPSPQHLCIRWFLQRVPAKLQFCRQARRLFLVRKSGSNSTSR